MRADEALAQSNGRTIYAVFHNDLLRLSQREDDHYVIEFVRLEDANRQGTYVNKELVQVLAKDKRWLAEWYLTEKEAFNGKQPEEFFVYTSALYQHKETKQVIHVKLCNGEVLAVSTKANHKAKHKTLGQEGMRDFLLNHNEYIWLTSWWIQTTTQSDRDVL